MLQTYLIVLVLRLSTAYDNIALNKPAWQFNQFNPGNDTFDASNAVDGLKSDLSWLGGQCAISATHQETATWRVDLEYILSIRHVTIYYRTDNTAWDSNYGFAGSFLGFSLYISNTTDKTQGKLCFRDTSYTRATIPSVLNVTCPVHGRYVIYHNERLPGVTYPSDYYQFASNDLCEVEVYGCSKTSYYGPDCSVPCPDTNCRYCHIETGTCQGCKPGYQGHHCELPCTPQYYGELCKETCGNCSDGMACNNVDGICTNGCDVGVHGVRCKNACPGGWHGKNCSLPCGSCDACDRFTGKCTTPCYLGWKGQHCTDECDGRKYGFGCLYDCGACLDHKQCHHVNGSCLQGCNAGFQGTSCKTSCSVGSYGINCQGKCNKNCGVPGRCDKTTGQCDGGCQIGWRGMLCDTKCSDNLYGPGCNQTCGKCLEDKQCHHINGSCSGECEPGYRGDKCDKVCEFGYYGASCKEECSVFCQKSRDCHHVTGYCRSGCKTGWHGNDCLQVFTPALSTDSERTWETRFYGILCAFCASMLLHGVYIICSIRQWNKKRLKKNQKYRASDATICTKDTVLHAHSDEKVNSEYQDLGELSPSPQYDTVH